jgi:predicted nucleic acid-binding protein
LSVYSELLRVVLEETRDPSARENDLSALVAEALRCRDALEQSGSDRRGAAGADRLADSLAYDAALVRLCRHLGMSEELTSGAGGPDSRYEIEVQLAAQLPSLARC